MSLNVCFFVNAMKTKTVEKQKPMMHSRIFTLIVTICIALPMWGQYAIGEWDSFLSQVDGRWVTQSAEEIIYSNGSSLIYIDKDDESVRFVDKVDGLSDIGISLLAYDKANDQLIIAYNNSNLDIVKGSQVINLPSIKENTNITGSRQINDIYIDADGRFAYFATSFGIIQFDLVNLEFASTIFTDLIVNSITGLGNELFAATEDGLYYVSDVTQINIADFSLWQLLGENEGLPMVYEANQVQSYEGNVYLAVDRNLYKREANTFQSILEVNNNEHIRFLSADQSKLVVGVRETNGFSSRIVFFDPTGESFEGGGACINRLRYGIEDEKGRMWYADDWRQIRHTDNYTSGCHKVEYNSPRNNGIGDLAAQDGKLYVASGGITDSYVSTDNRNGFYVYNDGKWTNYNDENVSSFINTINLCRILPTEDSLVYIGSFWNGLVEWNQRTETETTYNSDNSALQVAQGDIQRTRVTGMALDQQGNLWIANHAAPKPLVVRTAEGNWHSFDLPGNDDLANVIVDQQGYKWLINTGFGGGIVVFDDNGTIADPTDDRSRVISTSNSVLPTNVIRSLKMDREGSIWVGTASGAVVFECGNAVFKTDNCQGTKRKVTVDGILGHLLETEDVFTIEVDGANRKWFGTRNGIFVQSPNGEDQIDRITSENSPLFNNEIIDLSYDPQTGVMWIGSFDGIQSVRTETLGSKKKSHASKVYAFPNPVRPEYEGPIAIKGLVRDANVKITDINGRLVFETTALGGQAIWNGKDYNGRKADTGVYLVFSSGGSSFDTPDSFVTKILFVK